MDRMGRGREGGSTRRGLVRAEFDIFSFSLLFRGTHTPGFAHSAPRGRRISFVVATTEGRSRFPFSFVLLAVMYGGSTHPLGMNGPHQK